MANKMAGTNNMMSLERSDLRPGFDSAMFIETSHILQHPLFQNSPTMTRLLMWLLQETLAGRGDMVKSYTIAVEALGRPESFDSQIDSYPRVQTGRLRRTLETYYSQHGPFSELCLFLQPGSYRLRLAKLGQAYPHLYRPLSVDPAAADSREIVPSPFKDSQPVALLKKSGVTEVPTAPLIILSIAVVSMLVSSAWILVAFKPSSRMRLMTGSSSADA